MLRIDVPVSIRLEIVDYVRSCNFGKRNYGNGNEHQQVIGVIVEWAIHYLLLGYYPEKNNGFDGGYDFIYNGRYVDVKTRIKPRFNRPNDWNSFFTCQMKHKADTIIFCSYNSEEGLIEVCGWIDKSEIVKIGKFWPAGSKRDLGNGKVLTLRLEEYQLFNYQLNDIKTLCH